MWVELNLGVALSFLSFFCVDYVKIWISLFGIFTLLLLLCVSSMFHWTSHFW